MPTTITTTLYQFDELTDEAKDKAREWYRDEMDFCDFYGADTVSKCIEIAKLIGISIERKSVYYSIVGSQGDGVCFTGTYRYAQKAIANIVSEYCGEFIDSKPSWVHEPIQIARALQQVQRKHFYRLYASTRGNDRYYCQRTSVNKEDAYGFAYDFQEDVEVVEQAMNDFASWIHTRLTQEYEYQNSDEQVGESIKANEYTFTADGKREG